MENAIAIIEKGLTDVINMETHLFSTIKMEGTDKVAEVINAINSPTHVLKEMINVPVKIMGFHLHMAQTTDSETGELKDIPRVVFIGEKGETIATMATTVFAALKQTVSLFKMAGLSDWPEKGVTVKFKQEKGGKGNIYKMEVVKIH